jgi:hypothetical protein
VDKKDDENSDVTVESEHIFPVACNDSYFFEDLKSSPSLLSGIELSSRQNEQCAILHRLQSISTNSLGQKEV